MEPVCPDDGGVPADRRYSYARSEHFGVPDVAVGPSPSPRAEIPARGAFTRHVSDTSAYSNLGKTLFGVLS